MEYKKGDTVTIMDNKIQISGVVVKDGIDSKNKVRVRPEGFPFDMSISIDKNESVHIL